MQAVRAFVRLGRPLFLGGGFVLYALGAATVAHRAVDLPRYLLGQGAVTAFQLMTHYANDYFDLVVDRANATPTAWSGGSRVLVAGALAPRVALVAARVFAGLGLGLSAAVAVVAGPALLPLLLAIGALAWAYSAPPLRLCASGAGELDTALVVTVLVPLLACLLQAPAAADLRLLGLVVVAPALLQFAMLLAIEVPDAAGDARTGKRTLVVRLGGRRAAQLYAATTAAAFAWLPIAYALGLPARVAALTAFLAPVAAWRVARIAAELHVPSAYERLTLCAVALLVMTSLAELAGLLL